MPEATTVNPSLFQSQNNAIENAIQQILLMQVNTIIPAIINAVNSNGTYDIQPTLNYLIKNNPPQKPPILPNIPQLKIRFGGAEIKGQYKKGDAVIVGIAQRDITVLKKNWKQQTNPNSLRRFALPDGIILGAVSNEAPTTTIELKDGEINVTASTININGSLVINGTPYAQHQHSAGGYQAPNGAVTGTSGVIS